MWNKTLLKSVMLAGASISASIAHGQTVAVPIAGDTVASSQPRDATQAPAGQNLNTGGDIIVTAQRRSETNVEVPIAIAVVSGDALQKAGVASVGDLQQLVPGFTLGYRGLNSQPTLRGIGTQAAGPGISANIATYLDGIYQPTQVTTDLDLNDVQSIEVLKGPQGTLYGRNATGGAILITTRSPSFTPTADLGLSYGNFNAFKANVFATGPISQNLAASIAATYDRSDGYFHNIFLGKQVGGRNNKTVRAKALYKPTDHLSFELTYAHIDKDSSTGYQYNADGGRSTAALFPNAVLATKPFETSVANEPKFHSISNSVTLKSTLDLNNVTLTSYSSAAWQHNSSGFEFDGSSLSLLYVDFPSTSRTYQQELDLSSNSKGRLQWTTGLFLFDDYGDTTVYFGVPRSAYISKAALRTKSVAGFGELTYTLTDTTHLTVGGRINYDHVKEEYGDVPNVISVAKSASFTSFTPRAVLRQDVGPRQSIYLSYNAGNKAGLFNAQGASVLPVKPEKIDAFEVGYKAAGHRWSANAATYYYNYRNLQVTSIQPDGSTDLKNAASARIYGAEASVSGEVLAGLNVSVGASYVHARFVKFPDAPRYTFDPAAGIGIITDDASGDHFLNSPDYSAQASVNYKHSIGIYSIELDGNYSYRSTSFFDPFGDAKQPGYSLVNLKASLFGRDKRWGLGLYMKNAFNKTYKTQVSEVPLALLASYGAPRTFGGTLNFHW